MKVIPGQFKVVPAIEPYPVTVKVRRGRPARDVSVAAKVLARGSNSSLVELLSDAGLDDDHPMWKVGVFQVVENRNISKVEVPF